MITPELSVIIPFINEMPQIAFTIQALVEELEDFCDYEIIAIDNCSDDQVEITTGQRAHVVSGKNYFLEGHDKPDATVKPRTHPAYSRNYFKTVKNGKVRQINTYLFRQGKIVYTQYDDKLGHWNAKNHGLTLATGKYIFFLDAHCIMKRDSVRKMVQFLRDRPSQKIGGVHAYINYMLDSNSLEYRVERKTFGYKFCSCQKDITIDPVNGKRIRHRKTEPYKVCVMSTCGMMSPRSVIDELGAWNPEFGIYGGGESYINWKQSTCGYLHWIHPEAWCWHYADKRGYSWNQTDYMRNGMIAAYTVGGDSWLDSQVELYAAKGRRDIVEQVADNIRQTCAPDRAFIENKQIVSLDEYMDYWEANPGVWK